MKRIWKRLKKVIRYGVEISERKYEHVLEIIKLIERRENGIHVEGYIDEEFVEWYVIDPSIIINSKGKTAPEITVLNTTLDGLEKTLNRMGL